MKLLVLTSEPITAQQLRDDHHLRALALQPSPLKFWTADADEAIARAEEVRQASVDRLGEQGVPATGDTGESDPMQAIEDALQTFPAERIVLFVRPESPRYREDVDVQEVQERFGVPVSRATI